MSSLSVFSDLVECGVERFGGEMWCVCVSVSGVVVWLTVMMRDRLRFEEVEGCCL